MRVLPFGDRAVLAEVDTLAEVLALHAALSVSVPPGVIDLVPAARTVLVHVDPRELSLAAARTWIATCEAVPVDAAAGAVVELPIVYDGADLEEAAELVGVSPDELVRRHAEAEWKVAFTGFAPGFGYLVSDEWPFDVPRRATPRTRVPAGAVGLAGGFSGAYPRETPGGWQLIGTTPAPLFNPAASTPVLLPPGTRVRFRPAPSASAPAPAAPAPPSTSARHALCPETPSYRPCLGAETVSRGNGGGGGEGSGGEGSRGGVRVGAVELAATVQDGGRGGRAAEGIAVAGAADRTALAAANRLLGNAAGAAAIEIAMGGFAAVAERDLWFAVTGAWGPMLLDGHPVDPYRATHWPAGSELRLDWFTHGVRAYLAVRGGLDAPAAIGSRSTDTLAGLGPAPLRAGDTLPIGTDTAASVPLLDAFPWTAPPVDALDISLGPGPRADWFAPAALEALFQDEWSVSSQADRVGIRLEGRMLQRTRDGELASEGMIPGAIQVPPSGQPVILGMDGPVTGGYPVIAVVADRSLDALAQARPGTRLRFRHAH